MFFAFLHTSLPHDSMRKYTCPPVLRIYLKLLCTVASVVEKQRGNCLDSDSPLQRLRVNTCHLALEPVLGNDGIFVSHAKLLPYEGLLWKEALRDLVSSPLSSLPRETKCALLHHPSSEVRLGVLEGLQSVLDISPPIFTDEDISAYLHELLKRVPVEKRATSRGEHAGPCLFFMQIWTRHEYEIVAKSLVRADDANMGKFV